jgi:DNA polymerase-1
MTQTTLQPLTSDYTLITDEVMPKVLEGLSRAEEIGIDTETTGLDVRNGTDFCMGICVATERSMGYIPFRHKSRNVDRHWLPRLWDVLRTKPLIWHNRKFDMHSLRTLGVDPLELQGPQHDTLILAHLINEEWYSFELDSLARNLLKDSKRDGDPVKKYGELWGWENIPVELMAPYGSYDASLTLRLKQYLWPLLVSQRLESVYQRESRFTRVLYKMEQRGIGVNKDLTRDMGERGRSRMGTIHRLLKFNPSSTTDLGHYLLDELGLPILGTTPKGKPSFRKEIMEQYDEILQESKNPTARLIAEYRGWQKATTSLYEPLLTKIGPDGRIRTSFKQHGTRTGRLSSETPNVQQIPRGSNKPWNGKAKACFTAGIDGKTLIGWDYSQIELRVAASYGKETVLLREFDKEDADPFNALAPLIFGVLTPETRQDTKTFVYANLYGAGVAKIAATLGKSVEETQPLFQRYHQSIPGIIRVGRAVNEAMLEQGYITYWDGRKRHIRNRDERHKAWNSMIQGGAAQMVKEAMLRIEEFEDDDCQMVCTVHDEVTFIITDGAIKDYQPKIEKAMTDWPQWPVKFAVEGKAWS